MEEKKIERSFQLLKEDIYEIKEAIANLKKNVEKEKSYEISDKNNTEEIKDYEKFFGGKNVLITGGLGFIGSSIANRIAELNPNKVIIVDSLIKGLGSNNHNISDIEKKVKVYSGKEWDLRNQENMKIILKDIDCVFNLVGSVSHIGSKDDPSFDLELNLRSHLHFLDACRQVIKERAEKGEKKELKVIYAGTRDQYGKVPELFLPVNEDYVVLEVTDPQGINKHAAEFYHKWFRNFGIKTCSIRLSNVYGPRHIMTDPGQGVFNWFVRKAIDDETLELWGEGIQLRDFVYIDDAVEAFLLAMASEKTDGQVYNLGAYRKRNGLYEQLGGNIKSIRELAETVVKFVGTGKIKLIPYPEDRKSLEPGHFYADSTKIYKDLGWEPKISLEEGIKRTISFYRRNKKYYW